MPIGRSSLAFGALLALACESVIGAEFDGYQKFPSDSGTGTGGSTPSGGKGGTQAGGSAGSVAGGTSGTGGLVGGGSGGITGGGSGGSGGGSNDAAPDVVVEAPNCPALTTPYPSGPYGSQVDDVFPPLEWEGFVNDSAVGLATEKPFVHYSMDLVRKSCKKYALIHNSEFT